MKRERRSFDKDYKLMAVNLCLTGKSTKEVGEELGIRVALVRRWKRAYEQTGVRSFSGHGNANLTGEQKQIVHLKQTLKDAQIERDILKKAVSIFSKNDGKYFNS